MTPASCAFIWDSRPAEMFCTSSSGPITYSLIPMDPGGLVSMILLAALVVFLIGYLIGARFGLNRPTDHEHERA
jgi:hypothetical protein